MVVAASPIGSAGAQPSCAPALRAVGGEPAVQFDSRPVRSDADPVVDRSTVHVVAPGDSLISIGARYGVSTPLIAAQNALDPRKPLLPGQWLEVTARHVVPPPLEDGIVLNVPQRMLFLFRAGRVGLAYPIAVGRSDWPTPTGEFTVVNRQTDKTWIVPRSIQEEMRRAGRPVLTEVPPGPDNPLGRHWIGLSLPAIGIHGTIAPASVYGFRSHGCIRVHPDDVAELFDRVSVGERGRIVYLPLLLSQGEDGRIWFEANPDAYRRGGGTIETVRAMVRDRGIAEELLDWSLIETMLRARDGLAREVGAARDRSAERSAEGG
ncbi:MAG: LysM peptidoglycan-binding domain-containing protein [Burkholderiales bacterium]|nr:MAG: LysM peptidoglycan-binding domain-containing protein [Burkholderiales bacterium]